MDTEYGLISIFGYTLETGALYGALAFSGVIAVLYLARALIRLTHSRDDQTVLQLERAAVTETRISEMARTQSELSGKLHSLGELLAARQSELTHAVAERLDKVSIRVGEGLSTGAQATAEQLSKLEARLAVIDAAQSNMTALTDQVSGLKAILANRPARGVYGQGRMEVIVRDALPSTAYSFQFTLSSNARPDCVIHLPADNRVLAIDAKFPLEAFEALRRAETPEGEARANAQLRQDMTRHIKDISEKYIVAGETQDVALLFVPSEALYADLQDKFEDLVQRSHRSRVLIVSPSLLMLAIQVVQGLVKDAALREQAHRIQAEVAHILEDVRRLTERTSKLKSHFALVSNDLDQIDVSASKIIKRGGRIEQMEFERDPGTVASTDTLPNPVKLSVSPEISIGGKQ
jgi:DNA recombination protein RmuC